MIRPILLACLLVTAVRAERYSFEVLQRAEVVATVEMSSPGSDWAVTGREAAVVNVRLDSKSEQQVILYAGAARHTYRLALGSLAPGTHEITVEQNLTLSAPETKAQFHDASFTTVAVRDSDFAAYANMPYLFARKNTVGKFSDVPLIAYCESLRDGAQTVLQYTVI